MPDLPPRARVLFAGGWLALQATLVLTAASRPDGAFGFRMFPEASSIEVHLAREVAGGTVAAPGGEWSARDAAGQLRHFSWRDRVRDPALGALDARVFAPYGGAAQVERLQRALDDAADHLPEDAETIRLRAQVTVWRNGGEPTVVALASHARSLPSGPPWRGY